MQSGDWVTPRLNGVKYFEKPILQYWISAIFFWIFGYSEFVARLYPGLMGFSSVVLVFFTARRIWNLEIGFLAAWILGTSVWWIGNGHFLTLDMGLSACLCGVLCGFMRAQQASMDKLPVESTADSYKTESEARNWMLFAWAAMAFAVLQKGLIGLVIPSATLVFYTLLCRDWCIWTRLHFFKGLLLFFVISMPWFVLVSKNNPDFLWFFFIHEHIERFLTTTHRRTGAWWYFFPILFAGFLPWISLLPQAIIKGFERVNKPFQIYQFLLIWATFIFIFFSKSDSKLPSYILPLFPALAFLASHVLYRLRKPEANWHLLPGLLLGISLIIAMPVVAHMGKGGEREMLYLGFSYWLGIAGVVVIILMLAAFWFIQRQQMYLGWVVLGLTTLIGGQIASLGHNHFARTNSSWYLTQAIKPVIGLHTKLYVFRTYDQTLPFYLQRHLQFVEYRDEFDFGQQQEPNKWMDILTFKKQWTQDQNAILITAKPMFKEIEDLPGKVIYEDTRRIVLKR